MWTASRALSTASVLSLGGKRATARGDCCVRSIIEPLAPHERELWGHQTIKLRHRLASLDLFTDDTLAKLIETAPPKSIAIHTKGGDDPSGWPSVMRGDLPGARVLDAVRNGTLWINLVGISEWDPR